jgi:hypothetical protein
MSASEIWLIDSSASMAGERYRRLREQLATLHAAAPHVKLIVFSTAPRAVEGVDRLPSPGGSTALHLALELAQADSPGKDVVWSDGEPDDEDAALGTAASLPGVVDTLFFGDEGDHGARRFMERLARDNGGRWIFKDILKNDTLLSGDVRELLGLPAPIAARPGPIRDGSALDDPDDPSEEGRSWP